MHGDTLSWKSSRKDASMKKTTLLFVLISLCASFVVASSKISDESFQLIRRLVSYKNQEIAGLESMNEYMLDCQNVSDTQSKEKKCADRLVQMQKDVNDSQVKHDVLGHEIAAYIQKHKDEEWIFLGLMGDDKEFSNLAH
jgi:hypothetical protein